MITQPIKLVHVFTDSERMFGLDVEGELWYHTKPPAIYTHLGASEKRKKEEEEAIEVKKPWRRFCMMGVIAEDDMPASKQIPPEINRPFVDAKMENAVGGTVSPPGNGGGHGTAYAPIDSDEPEIDVADRTAAMYGYGLWPEDGV